jgi:dipeptidyl-peptidase-4
MIKANKEYDSEYYPNKNHGIYGGNTRYHLFNRITDYILTNL